MKPTELYKIWAPDGALWSDWAKPVLFARNPMIGGNVDPAAELAALDLGWVPAADQATAIILDLPRAVPVWWGLALSQRGYRPVPLFNGVCEPLTTQLPLVDVKPIIWALNEGTGILMATQLPLAAPPVFLLDSNRMAGGNLAAPGRFDNRWWVFPQDFPSANFLQAQGIRSVILGQQVAAPPQRDLAHVLLRWQEAGIPILAAGLTGSAAPPRPIQVFRPDKFRSLWYRALALVGLRRNSTGGFGAVVPEPGSSGGFG